MTTTAVIRQMMKLQMMICFEAAALSQIIPSKIAAGLSQPRNNGENQKPASTEELPATTGATQPADPDAGCLLVFSLFLSRAQI